MAGAFAEVSDAVRARARELMSSGKVMAMDALHVAVAIEYRRSQPRIGLETEAIFTVPDLIGADWN
uniref:Uncharacterized protein n=1 Tax=Candidatus Kentrum eta TaxID=2126337 RepID=A0A450UQP7_9GAMM|nr:MAG: hypothetical protein BECKH772A_GA0070896_100085 [Candidatus Kentron sp. H]VFJ93575.1 MAG: hypothetical protein BECKH772B_GA0070898_1004623 [Candidatus Kentron sp. H]VFJ94893.1 MAG: hypothetical protein BECKH772C_GA0070978_1000143 [Candidatus Kentron sp. H]